MKADTRYNKKTSLLIKSTLHGSGKVKSGQVQVVFHCD